MTSLQGEYIVITEKNESREVSLNDKTEWLIGRVSSASKPDIPLTTATVSRKHGRFVNCMGIWYYYNCCCKNNTFINGKLIKPGIGGRIRPVMLKDGDELLLGAGSIPKVNDRNVKVVFHKTIG